MRDGVARGGAVGMVRSRRVPRGYGVDGGGAPRRRRVVAETDLRRHRVGGVGRAPRVPAVGFGAKVSEGRDEGRLRVRTRSRAATARVVPTRDRRARLRVGRGGRAGPARASAARRRIVARLRDARVFEEAGTETPQRGTARFARRSGTPLVVRGAPPFRRRRLRRGDARGLEPARVDSTASAITRKKGTRNTREAFGTPKRARAPTRDGNRSAPSLKETPKFDRDSNLDRAEPRSARPVHHVLSVPSAGAARVARRATRARRSRRGVFASRRSHKSARRADARVNRGRRHERRRCGHRVRRVSNDPRRDTARRRRSDQRARVVASAGRRGDARARGRDVRRLRDRSGRFGVGVVFSNLSNDGRWFRRFENHRRRETKTAAGR